MFSAAGLVHVAADLQLPATSTSCHSKDQTSFCCRPLWVSNRAVEVFPRLAPEHEHRTWTAQCRDSERNIIKEEIKSNINRQQSDAVTVQNLWQEVIRCVVQILGFWSWRFIWNLLTKLQSFWSTFVWPLDSGHGGSVLVLRLIVFDLGILELNGPLDRTGQLRLCYFVMYYFLTTRRNSVISSCLTTVCYYYIYIINI